MTIFKKWLGVIAVSAVLVAACVTGRVAADRSSELRALATELAPFLPAPAGGLAELAAERVDAAVAAYVQEHPEKFEQELGLDDWLAIAGLALFGGQTRRTATGVLTSAFKGLAKAGGRPA